MFRSSRQLSLLLVSLLPQLGGAFSANGITQGSGSPVAFGGRQEFGKDSRISAAASNDDWWYEDFPSDKDLSSSDDRSNKFELSNDNTKKGETTSSSSPFLKGQELKQLRSDLEYYRENLKWAEVMEDNSRITSLKEGIEEMEKKDPEVVYNKARRLISEAKAASRSVLKPDLKEKLIDHWSEQKKMARDCLVRFQMEGLWVGNYGSGSQLINITYAGDTMVATKVTGDDTVPRGEVSFTANLSPPPLNSSMESEAATDYTKSSPPVSEEHTILQSKYGESIFPGQGQLAKKDFKDPKFISGVFMVYDSHRFSFSWVPTKHHVFFVRPSPLETIRLLRDVISQEDEIDNMRDHLSRCYDMDFTTSLAREHQRASTDEEDLEDPMGTFKRIHRQGDLELLRDSYVDEDGQEGGSIFKFWRANKFRKYIDSILGRDGVH